MEPKRIQFVHPFIDKEANMVLIESVRGGKSMVKIEEPIIVYEKPGEYTNQIHNIYGF
jgi:tRNA1Val (adenine37-N6)-methyltransferase